MYQEGGGDGLLATLPQAEQATCFPANYAHVAASVSPGLAGPRSCWILIEQRLNPVMVLLKQRPDLPLLFRSRLQIFRKAGKFLVNRFWAMDMPKLLTR